MTLKTGWLPWISSAVLALALILTIRSDLAHLHWAAKLSMEGSPPPARDPASPTGYVLGQRHFLGTHQRGETYRWIADTQDLITSGPFAVSPYHADTVPEGRPQLLPKLYSAWLAAVSSALHVITGEPMALAVEQAALWEPVISHAVAFLAAVSFMWIRLGPISACIAGLFFALFPPVSGQFLSGVLTTETWALLLATGAIALALPGGGKDRKNPGLGAGSAVAASLAVWLDPAYGFPAVLIVAAAGVAAVLTQNARLPWLRWSLIGSGITLAAWLIDQNPWSPAAGELRYVHPLYALAWLGIGLGLDGWQNLRTPDRRRRVHLAEIVAAIPLVAALVYSQLTDSYKAWLHTSVSMRRLTSLDETAAFNTIVDWVTRVSFAEVAFVSAPALVAMVALAIAVRRKQVAKGEPQSSLMVVAVVLAGVVAFALFKVHWAVIASLIALPLIGGLASIATMAYRRAILALATAFVVGLLGWGRVLPASLQRPSNETPPTRADLDALIHRHFAHWLASHNPGQAVSALAPPELSDSIVFHGGCRVLMSSAWESYPGQVAASRILSAPEASEAEAVLESRGITHIILPSWDKVLSFLVRQPAEAGKDTLYARLQRWVHPRYLRPVPYRLPPVTGYQDQKLAVFKVVPPQDEALTLSRLAEYFVEMDRAEPAGLAADVLAESFRDDPNAVMARALVHAHANEPSRFEVELTRLAADVTAGRVPLSWDRRVQRAIVLALGRRHELARKETEACIAGATEADLFDLTPLQAHRLGVLAGNYGLEFPDPASAERLSALGAEYDTARNAPPAR